VSGIATRNLHVSKLLGRREKSERWRKLRRSPLAKEQKDAAKQPSSQGRGRFDALQNPRKIAPFDHDPAIPTLAAGTAVAPAYAPMRSPLGPNGQAVPAPRLEAASAGDIRLGPRSRFYCERLRNRLKIDDMTR
jgi:hypothetical protein